MVILTEKQIRRGRIIFWSIVLLLFSLTAFAASEKEHTRQWCHPRGGEVEHVLPDNTRVDCLDSRFSTETEWARNWKDGIGQAIHYAHMTGQHPAILLIMSKEDKKYLRQLKAVVKRTCYQEREWGCTRIKIFTMEVLP